MHDNIIYMPRQQRTKKSVSDIAERFAGAAVDHLGMTSTELWQILGYANPSTLQAVRKGRVLPDFVRIAEHSNLLRDSNGRGLNLHWVITGEGSPLLQVSKMSVKKMQIDNDIISKIQSLKPTKKAVLVKFLSEFT